MSYIYICYSRHDKRYVEILAGAISQHGLNTWFDVGVEGGNWHKVAQKIDRCSVFVVVMSPDAEESEWVEREIIHADSEAKPIIPLLLDGRPFDMLSPLQYYDVRDGGLPDEDAFDRLARFMPQEGSLDDTAMIDPTIIAEVLSQTGRLHSLWYSKEHVWVRELANDAATIGLTDFGQRALGEVLNIERAPLDTALRPGDTFAAIEARALSTDLFSPIGGAVNQINPLLNHQPELINSDPYGKGWLLQTRNTILPNLMNAAEYMAYCKTL